MLKVREVSELCTRVSPFEKQEVWDKSGLNLGSFDDEIEHIVVCLELNSQIAYSLQPRTLVITHHPLFFKPINAFCTHLYPANLAKILLNKDCALIALHTNFDLSHLNAYLVHKILKWEHFVQEGLFMRGEIAPLALDELAQYVCNALGAKSVNLVRSDNPTRLDSNSSLMIHEVYVVCGSGCSMLSLIPPLPSTCFVTSDIKHHDAMMAKSMGISLIDMGHYESEKYFVEIFESILQNAGYKGIIADCENPFSLCLRDI